MACSAPSPAPAARPLPRTDTQPRAPAAAANRADGAAGWGAAAARPAPPGAAARALRRAGLELPLQLLTGTQFHACHFLNPCRDEMKEAALTSPRGRCSIAYSQRHLGRESSWKWLGAAEEPPTVPTPPSGPKASLPSPSTYRFLY